MGVNPETMPFISNSVHTKCKQNYCNTYLKSVVFWGKVWESTIP
jgi:hypothetical protein